jgi:hypothetical protein
MEFGRERHFIDLCEEAEDISNDDSKKENRHVVRKKIKISEPAIVLDEDEEESPIVTTLPVKRKEPREKLEWGICLSLLEEVTTVINVDEPCPLLPTTTKVTTATATTSPTMPSKNGTRAFFLPCHRKHVFCSICIQMWLEKNNTCPVCRKV